MRLDFKREQRAIRSQVEIGKRCAECLRPFNLGQRKYFIADKTYGLICANCFNSYNPFSKRTQA